MKNVFFLCSLFVLLSSCNPNPNKEERIQKLEDKIVALELKIKDVETHNSQIEIRLLKLEER